MNINPINNKESFFFKPLKIIQSLGWVAVAILALPTVVGPYFAWKKLAAIWSKNERSDTKKADEIASGMLLENGEGGVEDDEDGVLVDVTLDKDCVEKMLLEEEREVYEQAIQQFKGSNCLGSNSAKAYFDYLKKTERSSGFHFNMDLLYNMGSISGGFLEKVKEDVTAAKKEEASLVFVPFLLARSLFHEQHIVVAIINLKDERIEYFDPKGNRFYFILGDRNLAQENISAQTFLEKLSKAIFPDKSPEIIRNINHPQSLWNRVDCGAHALEFIEKRLSSDSLEQAASSLSLNGRQLRDELANTLQYAKTN